MRPTLHLSTLLALCTLVACDRFDRVGDDVRDTLETVETASAPQTNSPSFGLAAHDLEREVRRRLLSDDAVPATEVEIDAELGVVALRGSVPHLLAKERAVRLAGLVGGVRTVSDQLEVTSPTRADALIEDDMRTAMLYDPAVEALDLVAVSKDQRVTLRGTVDSFAEYAIAERLAKSVRGVRSVDNALTIAAPDDRPDRELSADILARMRWDALLDARMVRVEVSGGVASLHGTVGSLGEHARALADAWVPGVRRVIGRDLEIQQWAKDPQQRVANAPTPSDEDITEAIELAMLLDPRIQGLGVTISVHDGVAVLAGSARTLAGKDAALGLAHNTVGVRSVESQLVVSGQHIDDEALTRALGQLLELNPITEHASIEVDVDDGVVTLSGSAPGYAARAEARDIAARTAGVREVNQDIEVAEAAAGSFSPEPLVAPYHPIDHGLWSKVYVSGAKR